MSRVSRAAAATLVVLVLVASSSALAEAPLAVEARAGEVRIEAVQHRCETRLDACARASRRIEVRVGAGAAPTRVRVLRVERWTGTRWVPLPIARVQVDTARPMGAHSAIMVAAGERRTIGLLHRADLALPARGVRYRVTLEVDGRRYVVHPSERLVVEHPR